MNPEKAKLKIAIINDIGADMEDIMESSRRRSYALEGASEWMGKIHQGIAALSARVDEDRDGGKCTQEQAAYAKRFLGMAMTSAADLAKQAMAAKLGQEGVAQGIQKCVDIAKKKMDQERLKLEAEIVRLQKLQEEQAPGVPKTESPVQRPRTNARAQDLESRKAKAKAKKAAAAPKKAAKKKTAKRATKKAAKRRSAKSASDS